MTKIFLSYLIFLLAGCTSAQFDRRKEAIEFAHYILDRHQLEDYSSYYLVILQSNMCGACTVDVIDFLSQNLGKSHKKKILVMTVYRDDIYTELHTAVPDLKIIEDKEYKVEDFGLRMTKDLLFHIENGEISYWSYLADGNYDQIERYIKRH